MNLNANILKYIISKNSLVVPLFVIGWRVFPIIDGNLQIFKAGQATFLTVGLMYQFRPKRNVIGAHGWR